MKAFPKFQILFALMGILLLTSACGLPQVMDSTPSAPAPATTAAQATQPATNTPAPVHTETTAATQPASDPTPGAEPAYTGFVVFQQDQQEFQIYNFDGQLRERIAAPGFQAFSRDRVDVIGENIYYFSNIDQKIFLANSAGLQVLPYQPPSEPFGFKISPDEKQIAWSVIDWNSNPIVSELWVGSLDGSSANKVASITSNESPAFLFIPLEWTADGKLLFNRSPTGFGGYILYGGSNSLYSFDPASQELVTFVPAEEMHGLCLDHYRIDLSLAAFNCSKTGPLLAIRDLNTGTENQVGAIPDYPIMGSARFSPSGIWLAYAAARGNPDAEAGRLLVQPTDLSTGPAAIANLARGFYFVQAWIDENTLLVTRNEDMSTSILFKIQRDGSGTQDLAKGWFVMMTP
jgi:hypothetical protein